MTKEEILAKAKCVLFPKAGHADDMSDFADFIGNHETLVLSDLDSRIRYSGIPTDSHHFTTRWHYYEYLPKLARLLDFQFSPDDFYLVENFQEINGKTYDFSYFLPKKHTVFCTEAAKAVNTQGIVYTVKDEQTISYNYLVFTRHLFNSYLGGYYLNPSFYHMLFYFSHASVKLVNVNAQYRRVLLVSGDSHCIPIIPVLGYYFYKVIYLDKRNPAMQSSWLWETEKVTDALFSLFADNKLSKYTETNLR